MSFVWQGEQLGRSAIKLKTRLELWEWIIDVFCIKEIKILDAKAVNNWFWSYVGKEK